MMSPFPFEPKMSGAASAASGGLPAGAFASEAGAKAARNSAELKRSFASMLGQVKKEAPAASSAAPAVKSPQGLDTHHQAQQAAEVVKSKSPQSTRPSAAETRARATRDPEGRVDDSGEQERPTDLPTDQREESAVISSDAVDAAGLVSAWLPPTLPIEEATPINLCASGMPFESAPVDSEATALTITAEASPTSGGEGVRAPVQVMPAIVKPIVGGCEAAQPAAFAAAQTPSTQTPFTQTPATPSPVLQTRQAEDVRLNFNEATEGKAVNADGERSTPQDPAGAFKLPAGLNAVTAQPVPTLAAASMPRSLKAEKTAALSSAPSAKGDESAVLSVFNSSESTNNKLFKKVDTMVGPASANNDSNMSSPLLDFSAASPSDAPATEAVTRVNLVQVVDEVAAITEKVRISGQQRCVVDLDVTGHGKLRVEVVRRADQVETVLSTDSASLRESLQAAFDRSDRPTHFSSSFQWQGSPDTSGRGQNGAQADADSRQNLYSKAEPATRVGRTSSLPVVPVAPAEAPVLAANHRLQIFA
jgi:hypothetical protein